MNLIPWALVGLLLGALYIVWTLTKARIEGLLDDLDYERNENEEAQDALTGEIAELRAQVEKLQEPPLKPAVPYKPTHRRAWPTPEGMVRGERAIDTGTDIIDRSVYRRTALDDKVALARLGMDCAVWHEVDCDCLAIYRLMEHEAALGEGD